jgi:hypothetical protein
MTDKKKIEGPLPEYFMDNDGNVDYEAYNAWWDKNMIVDEHCGVVAGMEKSPEGIVDVTKGRKKNIPSEQSISFLHRSLFGDSEDYRVYCESGLAALRRHKLPKIERIIEDLDSARNAIIAARYFLINISS